MFDKIFKMCFRATHPVSFIDLCRNTPVSSVFGLDRGMPIDRYYIEYFLHTNRNLIKGDILEVAENTYSKRFGTDNAAKYNILSYTQTSNATIVGDLTKHTTLPSNSIDCFICTQTFNFIYDVRAAIRGAHHLLKTDGVLLATVAGLTQISRYDMDRWGDYWRFTDLSIKKLFEEAFGEGHVDVVVYGNVLAAMALLQGIAVEDLPDKSLLDEADENYQVTIGIVARK